MRLLPIVRLATSFVVLASLVPQGRAAEDANSLLRFLPPTSNTLAVVKVRQILESPRAKREGWKGESLKFLAGAETVPTWIDALVTGGQFLPGGKERWSASVLYCPAGVSVEAMAKGENRALQQLGGVAAMHTNRNAYYVQLQSDVVGVLTPALRQETSRWVRAATSARSAALSDFLTQAAKSDSHIVMAIDMQDMLDPQLIRKRLESAPSLKGKTDVVSALEKLFRGLKGVAFFATIGDQTDARIDMIFSEKLAVDGERLKALLLEMLSDEQLMLEDFAQGKATARGAVLSVDTNLSDVGLRRILSLILSPFPQSPTSSGAVASDDNGRPVKTNGTPPPKTAPKQDHDDFYRQNRNYYVAVQRALRDLQDQKTWASNYNEVAGWFDKYAQKIENLPAAGIDPELVDFATDVASKLRTLANTTRGMVIEVNAAQSKLVYRTDVTPMNMYGGWGGGWGWGWGGWGGWGAHWSVTSNLEDVRAEQAASMSTNAKQCDQIRSALKERNDDMRRRMEQKYGNDFVKWTL